MFLFLERIRKATVANRSVSELKSILLGCSMVF